MPTTVALDDFSRIVAGIYSAVLTPDSWTAVLGDLRSTFDGQSCALVRAGETGRTVVAAHLAPEVQADYERYYHRLDYVLEAVERGTVGALRTGHSLVALQSQSEFHIDWLRPLQMTDGLFVRLSTGTAPLLFLTAGPRSPEPFVPLVTALVPHLQQALRSQAHLEDLHRRADELGIITQTLRHGIILVTNGSRVVYANTTAEEVLRSADGLLMRAGHLEAATASADDVLQRSVHAALATDPTHRTGSSLLCKRRSGLRPYVIDVIPIDPAADTVAPRRAMVAVVDPEADSATPVELLRRVYGLTAGEADVVLMMLEGGGIKQVAEHLSLSPATVKTHLQHVFDKTGAHRQADLVRVVLNLRSVHR